jgi:catalase
LVPGTVKHEALEPSQEDEEDQLLTSDQGLRVNDDQNSLKAGAGGPSLLEDFILREKSTDQESLSRSLLPLRPNLVAHSS